MPINAIVMILLGVFVLAFGPRLVILGAAVGALFGFVLLRFIPGSQDGLFGLLIPLIVAVVFAFGGGLLRTALRLVTIALGAVAGASIVLGALELFGASFGILDWILALVGAGVGTIVILQFKEWAIYLLAGLVGALLIVRGVQIWFPAFDGVLATIVGLVLAAAGIAYQSGLIGGRKQQVV